MKMKRFLLLCQLFSINHVISGVVASSYSDEYSHLTFGDSLSSTSETSISLLSQVFETWMGHFDKEYPDDEEKEKRMLIWASNHELIQEHNNQEPPPSFYLGHNHFSDLTLEEFQKLNRLGEFNGGFFSSKEATDTDMEQDEFEEYEMTEDTFAVKRRDLLSDIPASVNWVTEGAVTEIKNQGACGSCWAFSAVAAVEGAKFLETGELVDLSEQELLDCDDVDKACMGGLMDDAFKFVENVGGLCSEQDYPYTAKPEMQCQKCDAVSGTNVAKIVDVGHNIDALLEAIAQQPVSVAIEANQFVFQFYKSGVFDKWCGKAVDHGVVAVGYGEDDETGLDYWLIKNSWGSKWGEDGYMKMGRESKLKVGKCGILTAPSLPVLS